MSALYPWASEPWGSAGEGEDFSLPDPLVALRSSAAELAWLVRIAAVDPDTEEEVPVYLSSHGYHTAAGGDGSSFGVPDFQHFDQGLESPASTSVSIISGGSIVPGSTPTHGALTVSNPDGRFNSLRRLRFRRREFRQWVGEARWMGPRFAEFTEFSRGSVEDVTWDRDTITFSLRDPKLQFSKDLNPEAYLGFGTAIRCRTAGDGVAIDASSILHPLQVHFRIVFKAPSLSNMVLLNYGWEETNQIGWELRATADGGILWVQDAYDPFLTTASGLWSADKVHRASWEGGPAGVKIYLDGVERASLSTAYTRSTLVDSQTQRLRVGKRASF